MVTISICKKHFLCMVTFTSFFTSCITLTESNYREKETEESYKDVIMNRKLEWADFKGMPERTPGSTQDISKVYWNIHYYQDSSYTYGDNYFEPGLKVWCAFNTRSWVLNTYETDYLLNHMQGHFDIARIFADSMAKLLPLLKPLKRTNWKQRVDSLHKIVILECEKMQARYDRETNHATTEDQQLIWDERLSEKLKGNK